MRNNKLWLRLIVPFIGLVVLVDFYLIFFYAPPEKYMGDVQRLMYFHIPSAWIAFLAFFIVFIMSILYLIKKDDRFDRLAYCSAELGVLFTTLVLITGPIWARPIWNTWWTWDPRLTTTLILWFIYIGYLVLRSASDGEQVGKKVAAIFGIVGFIDVPIVHLSVKWWRSIHPVDVVSERGMNMTAKMSITLLFSGFTFMILAGLLLYLRLRLENSKAKVKQLHLRKSVIGRETS